MGESMIKTGAARSQAGEDPFDVLEYVRRASSEFISESAENRLGDFAGVPVFDTPLIGVVDGRDPIFEVFREVVSTDHLMPFEILGRYSPVGADLSSVSVVSWALPFSREVRRSNRGDDWPSALYSVARNNASAIILEMSRQLTGSLRGLGLAAVSPVFTLEYDAFRSAEHAFSSTWSERHVAYAAGLGRFGLHGSLITRAGSHVRFGSLIVNLSPTVGVMRGKDYRADCFATGGATCGQCRQRCPVGAISADGMDKERCYLRRNEIREIYLEDYRNKYRMLPSPIVKGGRREPGFSLGCALCQCGVPCEDCDPELPG